MPSQTRIDQAAFRRILTRNIALPLGVGVATAVAFVALVLYLLSASNWVEHSERVIGNTQEIARLVGEKESALRGFLLTGDENFLRPYETAKPKLMAEINTLADLVSDNSTQVDRMIRVRALQSQWDSVADGLLDAHRRHEDYASLIRSGSGSAEREETNRELDTFLSIEQTLRLERVHSAQQLSTATVIVFLVFSLSLSALLAWFGRRELLQLSRAYGSALEEHEVQADKLHHQAWLRSGQTLLADQVMGQRSVEGLCQSILQFLATYLDVSVAAFYVRGADGRLTRTATLGFEAIDSVPKSFWADVSLVGQAVATRRLTCIEDVPVHYWKVTSALGAGVPSSLAILPVQQDGAVNSAIELGFTHTVTERDREFLKLIADNVGGFVDAAQFRERLQVALEETQQLNEELQTQQEELRVANEELEQQTAALAQSHLVLGNQKAELEQTNDQLSEQARILDEKNSALNTAQAELEIRAADLQRASRYKSEFLANMSHELRTPLNSSLILSKLLTENKTGNLSPEQIKYASTIYSAGNDLLILINDILDLSKVEAGKLDLSITDVPVQRVLDSLTRVFEPLAQQKHLEFRVSVTPGTPSTVRTDEQRIEQILKNLLSNAIKFTGSGEVSLILSPAEGSVQFAVRDSGIGIQAEHIESIFEAFQQADGTTNRQYGGTGLGLSISRSLAVLLGGSITVQSTPGEGSLFSLHLPIKVLDAPGLENSEVGKLAAPSGAHLLASQPSRRNLVAPVPVPVAVDAPDEIIDDDRHQDASGRRLVLVIEDEPQFAAILLDLAHELDYRCIIAGTATGGIKFAQERAPNAILLDIGLPDRSGLAVLQELKNNPGTRHIPVHVVSASDRTATALHLGAIGHAVKPTTREQLEDIFRRLEEKSSQEVKRVLLVEDDARQRESIVQLISDSEVSIIAVESGEEALDHLKSTIFDCMIIDLMLPDMQGSELLRRMTSTDASSFPPVIVYTGRSLTQAEETDLLRYSQSIIVKGARSPERLLDEVTLFLHKVETDLSTERQAMLRVSRGRDLSMDGRKVLLVDDDIRNVFSMSSALEHHGLNVEIGRNGFEALEALEQHPDVDIVLMDIMMPGMDGLEAIRRIRSDLRFKRLPIIAITAKAMKNDQEQCLAAGASDYLAKPIDLDRLYSLLRVWMPRRERFN
jgi:CheY-like chemotaxis protein/signal transduction histidine kinase/CHASE3 domain sensor protein